MKKTKMIISSIMIFMLSITMILPAYADAQSNVYDLTINGTVYNISESTDFFGNRVVIVNGDGEINKVIKKGDNLLVETKNLKNKKLTSKNINLYKSVEKHNVFTQGQEQYQVQMYASATSDSSIFWDYSYYSGAQSQKYGIYWSLTAGKNGNVSKSDNNNMEARGYAEGFMSDVQSIKYNQASAIAATSFAIASGVAGALSAAATLGTGTVIGIVLGAGGLAVSVPFWVNAYSSSVLADYKFSRYSTLAN